MFKKNNKSFTYLEYELEETEMYYSCILKRRMGSFDVGANIYCIHYDEESETFTVEAEPNKFIYFYGIKRSDVED